MKIMPFSIPTVWLVRQFCAFLSVHLKKDPVLTRKIIMRIKITSFLLFLTIVHVCAKGFSQISVNEHNVPLEKVFSIIEKQSPYLFFYKEAEIKPISISVKLKNASIEEILEACLKNLPFKYHIVSNTISVSAKERSVLTKLASFFAASADIKGKVTDSSGQPLVGASIKVKGKAKHYKTNNKGEFFIDDVGVGATLIVTYVGYQASEITVDKENNGLTIVLIPVSKDLEEVMVSTGYQVIEKEQLTGAVSLITSDQMERRSIPSGNFLESLEGRLSGLAYNRNPNTPTSEQLTIRGVATFDGVKSPLIVIDGFPTDINLNSINPNTISSVMVLKDAAASSIYGARAANGVIVIETKNGKQGKARINFNSLVSIQNEPDLNDLNLVASEEYISVKRAKSEVSTESRPGVNSIQFDPITALVYDKREGKITEGVLNQKLLEFGKYHNIDEYNKLFYRPSLTQNYDLSLSGGSESNNYRVGLNYIKNKGRIQYAGNDRVILNLKDNYTISNRFKLELGGIYAHENIEARGMLPDYNILLPYMRIADENGYGLPNYNSLRATDTKNNEAIALGLFDRRNNPYQDFLTEKNTSNVNSFRGQMRLNTKIVSGLNLDVGGAYEYTDNLSDILYNAQNFVVRDLLNKSAQKNPATGVALYTDIPSGDILKKNNTRLNSYTFRSQLNGNIKFGNNDKHHVYGILGAEIRKVETNGYLSSFFGYNGQTLRSGPVNLQDILTGSNAVGFPEFEFGRPSISATTYFNQSNSDKRFKSYYSQLTYILSDKYFATGSVRLDQSNLFGTDPKNRNKPQWSAGLSWIVSKEGFMQGMQNWLDDLKLRGAYGLTGNVPQSNSGRFVILSTSNRIDVTPASPYNAISSPENQSIRWENTKNLNLGIDFAILKNRVSGSLEYYNKNTSYLLASTPADPTSGWSSYRANTANISNNGIEVALNVRNLQNRNFGWTSTLNASLNTNKIVKVYNADPFAYKNTNLINSSAPIAGYALNTLLSYDYAGLNENGIPTMITRDGSVKTLASNDFIFLEDLINSGTTTPKYVAGLANSFRYKDLELFMMFMFYGGHVTRVKPPNPNSAFPLKGSSAYWKGKGDELNTDIISLKPPFSNPNYSQHSFGTSIYEYASQYIRKADQLILRDIVLSYHLPSGFGEKIKLSDTQLRVQVQNPWRYSFSGNNIDMEAIEPTKGMRGLTEQPSFIFSLITQF